MTFFQNTSSAYKFRGHREFCYRAAAAINLAGVGGFRNGVFKRNFDLPYTVGK